MNFLIICFTITLSVILSGCTAPTASNRIDSKKLDYCFKQCPHPFTRGIDVWGLKAVQFIFDNPLASINSKDKKIYISYLLSIKFPILGSFECSECIFETSPVIVNNSLNFNRNLKLKNIKCISLPSWVPVSLEAIETEITKIIVANPQEITQCLFSCFPKSAKKISFGKDNDLIVE